MREYGYMREYGAVLMPIVLLLARLI